MTKDDLCEMLGVKKEGLKSIIKSNKLESRINDSGYGYRYIGSYKNGRNTIYELEHVSPDDIWRQIQNYYKVKDYDKHTQYTTARIDNLCKPRSTVLDISNIDISYKTAKRYDDILINENMIGEDKMVYVKHNLETKQFIEITEEDYIMFWKDNSVTKNAIGDVYRRKAKGELSDGMATYSIVELTQTSSVNGWVAYKFMSYKELEDAKKLRDWLNK